ncbi:hypothetical protein LTR95_009709 [Oleoguttula sp. CCFEE 5521]
MDIRENDDPPTSPESTSKPPNKRTASLESLIDDAHASKRRRTDVHLTPAHLRALLGTTGDGALCSFINTILSRLSEGERLLADFTSGIAEDGNERTAIGEILNKPSIKGDATSPALDALASNRLLLRQLSLTLEPQPGTASTIIVAHQRPVFRRRRVPPCLPSRPDIPGICHTSRQSRAETARMFFIQDRFKFDMWDMNMALVMRFDLLAEPVTKSFTDRCIIVTPHGEIDFHWRNLEAWLKVIWGASGQHQCLDGMIYNYGVATTKEEFAGRAQDIAKALRGVPWDTVAKVLQSLRNVFMRYDPRWGRDLN